MANQFVYPSSADLKEIEQVLLPRLTQDRLIFKYMPITEVDAATLMWEQRDDFDGLQQLRGLGGQPARVEYKGSKRYIMEPGAYGEFIPLDEVYLTEARKVAQFGMPIDLSDEVARQQAHLLQRRLDRIEYIGWALLASGTFSVSTLTGVLHTDAYNLQTASASVDWDTSATATPLADFRGVQLLGRGKSTNFGPQAEAVMNRVTFNKLVKNTNSNDLAGRRVSALLSPLNLDEINRILLGEGLPQIVIYDEGYTSGGTFYPYIADDKVVVVGARTSGARIAEYLMTRNVNNPQFAPGAYSKVIVKDQQVPLSVEVHDGHNGGPAIYFPGSVVVMSV